MKNKLLNFKKLLIVNSFLLSMVASAFSQTTIVNYDFNSGTSYSTLSPNLASNISCSATGTEAFTTYTGIASGTGAFTSNYTAGYALAMSNSSGTNTRYWTFTLGGSALNSYRSYKLYLQAQRSNTGAQTITIATSTDGTTYTNFATTMSPGNGSFTEQVFDLTGVTALDNQSSVYIRIMASGASGTGTLRIDNFEAQATLNNASRNSWDLTGNTGTSESTNFIGTTDHTGINIKTNDTTRIHISANGNINMYGNASADTIKAKAIKVGNSSLWLGLTDMVTGANNNISADNGPLLLQSMSGVNFNTILNYGNTGNVGVGIPGPNFKLDVQDDINVTNIQNKGYRIGGIVVLQKPWVNNIFVGEGAGFSNITGSDNSLIGYQAGYSINTGTNNSFLGTSAGYSNIDGIDNSFIGSHAGLLNDGNNNSFIGADAGGNNSTGNNNSFLGSNAGYNNITGSNNTYLGYQATGSAALTNATAIGVNASVTIPDALVLGSINGINYSTTPTTMVGIGTTAPTKRLEVKDGTANESGLMLTSLAGITPSLPTTTALTVDNTGYVVLRNIAGGTADADWYDVSNLGFPPMNINNDKYTFGNTYINIPTSQIVNYPQVRFGVMQDVGFLNSSGNYSSIAGGFQNNYNHISSNSKEFGINSQAIGSGCSYVNTNNYGGYFFANNATTNTGGYFEAKCCSLSPPTTAPTSYAIHAVGYTDCSLAGLFEGDVEITGTLINPSDARFKTNINTISSALNTIEQLHPVTFDFVSQQGLSLPNGNQYGLIAQEVEQILPDVVTSEIIPAKFDALGNMTSDTIMFKGVNINAFIPIALKGIQELKHQNDSLKTIISTYESRFTSIENMLSQCCSQQNRTMQSDVNATIQISADPTMNKQTQLYQNRPNPFNVKTTFAYTLGEGGNVELIVEDSYGRLVATLVSQNQTPGEYSVDWNAENITAGIYFYSLKVNGIVLVKKAIKF